MINMNFKIKAKDTQQAWKRARQHAGKEYTVTHIYWLGSTGIEKIFQCRAHRRR